MFAVINTDMLLSRKHFDIISTLYEYTDKKNLAVGFGRKDVPHSETELLIKTTEDQYQSLFNDFS